jgi:TRAP-type C4-dicarboxylate transport system permease large subunit
VLIPWQKRQGYPAGLCAANNATSAVIDILIPPSIPLILYSLVSGTSVADLFTAGIQPGLLMAGGFILTCSLIARRRGIHSEDPAVGRMELLKLGVLSGPALLTWGVSSQSLCIMVLSHGCISIQDLSPFA